ncbi:hypothetical protein SRRS_50330 [Sporomusa rhizae]|uniref:SH3 domain-containing protein n=1 Tax=Sporomusa rhizae TaxID=357999 RepID=UPI003529D9DB
MKKPAIITTFLIGIVFFLCLATPAQAVFTAFANTNKAKIYSEPNESAAVVEVLRLGDVVKVYTKSPDGQFWEVEHKGNHGWIVQKHLSPKDTKISKGL